jgi:hypothetical protein
MLLLQDKNIFTFLAVNANFIRRIFGQNPHASYWSGSRPFSSHWWSNLQIQRRQIWSLTNHTLLGISKIPKASQSTLWAVIGLVVLAKNRKVKPKLSALHNAQESLYFYVKSKEPLNNLKTRRISYLRQELSIFVKLFGIYLVIQSLLCKLR